MRKSVRFHNVFSRKQYSFIRKRRKLGSCQNLYAGLIVLIVPCVLCISDHPRLTFDQIFNSTTYVQIQHSSRPYNAPFSYSYIHNDFTNSQGNDFSKSQGNDFVNSQLDYPISLHNFSNSQHDFSNSQHDFSNSQHDFSNSQNTDFIKSQGNSDYDTKGNELVGAGFEEFREKEQLLVGFARDPFRHSVPEEDFLKGVSNVNPPSYANKNENRGKRGVLHLYNMIYCATGCEPLSYKGYGCYCGFLGSGRPTDGIDNCCKMHDQCYENIYCPFFTVYFQPYYWKCYRGQPLCALENYQTEHHFVNGCAARLCECDRKFAMCVRRYQCPRKRALCRSSPIRLLQNLLMFK